MKQYAVVFTPEAEEQLAELYPVIAFFADDATDIVTIVGVVYGGRNFATML